MSYDNNTMTVDEHKAWHVLCAETAGGLHQFDYWQSVPEHVKKDYLAKVRKEKTCLTTKI